MIVFDFLMTFFEDFIISYFLMIIFSNTKRYSLIFFMTFITLIETFILNNYFMNNELLFFSLVITWAISLCFIKKRIHILYLLLPCLMMGLLLISNISSFYFTSLIFKIKINQINFHQELLIIAIIISRCIFFLSIVWLTKIIEKLKIIEINNKLFEFNSFSVFIICLLSILTTIGESIVYGIFDYKIYVLLSLEFVIMCFASVKLFLDIVKSYNQKLEIQSQLLQSNYTRKMYFETNKLAYKLSEEKHNIYYILKKIENIAKSQNNFEIMNSIYNALAKIYKTDIPYTSKNPVLDYIMTKKICQLKSDKYDVIYIANIDEDIILNDHLLIKNLEEYIDICTLNNPNKENINLVIKIYKKAEYIIFKIEIDLFLDISTSIFLFDEKSTHIKKEMIDHQDDNKTIIKVLIQ